MLGDFDLVILRSHPKDPNSYAIFLNSEFSGTASFLPGTQWTLSPGNWLWETRSKDALGTDVCPLVVRDWRPGAAAQKAPGQPYKCEFFLNSAQPVSLRCHYVLALSRCNSRHTQRKQDLWEQNPSRLLLFMHSLIQRHAFQAAVGLISPGPGSQIWQYMALYFRSLGRLRKKFLKKVEPTLWNENTAYLQCSVKSPGFRSGCRFRLWSPGPVISSFWVAAASPEHEATPTPASEGWHEGETASEQHLAHDKTSKKL